MTNEQKTNWQRQVAHAIIAPTEVPAAEKLRLLTEWPILRAWAQSVLKRDPNKVPARTLDAYLRDALAWSGHLDSPALLLANDHIPVNNRASDICANMHSANSPIAPPLQEQKRPTDTAPHDSSQGNQDAIRPSHFDQYRHVCPPELQQRFDEEISDLYLLRADLAIRRDQLADIVEQAHYAGEEKTEDEASAQLADVAQQLVNADATIRAFWALVDVAYQFYQLNGEVMPIEDLREQAPVPDASASARKRAPRTQDYSKDQIDKIFVEAQQGCSDVALEQAEALKAERIRKNNQFLRDKRKADTARANGGELYEKWREQIFLRNKEMEEWGETLTAVQQEIVASAT